MNDVAIKNERFKYFNVFKFFNMVSVTLSIPEEVKHQMDKFTEINWSGFIRKAILAKAEELSWKEDMLKKVDAERSFTEWAVRAQHIARKNRFETIKKKSPL